MRNVTGDRDHASNDDKGGAVRLQIANEELLAALRTRDDAASDEDGLTLTNIDFSGCDLTGLTLTRATISGVVFDRANLTNVRIAQSEIENTTFRDANLTAAKFPNSGLYGVDFSAANLEAADFANTMLEDANFRDANLSRSIFDYGATEIDFLAAASVQQLNVVGVEDLEFQQFMTLRERGAIVHPGSRCPRCEKRAYKFADPLCGVCEGQGWIDCDEEEFSSRYAVDCPWCDGSGQVIYTIAGEATCLACEGAGMVGAWVIDRLQHDSNLPWEYDEYKTEDDELGWFSVLDTDLSGQSFRGALVEETSFHNCLLSGTDFSGSRFKRVKFIDCDLTGVVLANVSMNSVRFEGCKMAAAIWTGGRVQHTTAAGCDFSNAIVARQRLRTVLGDADER
jgi:uncharacterized protein YjbI with pentapeptide repeats